MSRPARILIVEDVPSQIELLRALLKGMGHEARAADTAGQALAIAQDWAPDVILVDLELPDFSGIELMRRLRAASVDAAAIVITANASINTAVEAMREGAVDFLVKPFNRAWLTVTIDNCLEKRALVAELRSVRQQLGRDRFFGFIGSSAPMQAIYRTIEAVAQSRASVFVTGESGTGKELAAEAVHRASPRRGKPLIALNCGAIPRDLLESEIFGHVKGAFTGATDNRVGAAKAADGGTLFLDEIGEMPLDMQVKLLRFIQTGSFTPVGSSRAEKVDIRFVCATNRDPQLEVQEGRFREDLFYRLYVVPIELPPLRERGDDVLEIARHFLATFAREENKRFQGFTEEAEWMLVSYRWPGNIRQLQNVIRNIVVLHDGEVVTLAMLPPILMAGASMEQLQREERAVITAATPAPVRDGSVAGAVGRVPGTSGDPGLVGASDVVVTAGMEGSVPADGVARGPVGSLGVAASAGVAMGPAVVVGPGAVAGPAVGSPAVAGLAVLGQAVTGPAVEGPMVGGAVAPSVVPAVASSAPVSTPAEPAPIEIMPLAEMERRLIQAALAQTGHDVPRAATMLGVNPSTIYRKLQQWRAAAQGGAARSA